MNNQFRQYNRIAIITVLALLEFLISSAQTIPLDPALKIGKLPNGFTYYIRRNTMPAKRAQLYLVNKFGSLVEDDDQQGLAHFMEHMNFNGTKNFPKNELIEYLQKSGVRFGADVNAHTGFEETVYELPLPSDDPQLLRNGIGIMRDWAQEALLEPVEIDKERGVILEEARLRKGTSERMSKTYMPMLLNHSRYTSRFPIGLEEILKTFPPKAIARFKKDWYRPDLQALIVVGDVDTAHIEKLIIEKFSDLSTVANARKCIPYEIPLTGGNQFLLVTDKEMLGTTIEILYKHRQPELKTQADYRRSIVQSLYGLLVNFRKQSEISKEKDPAFTDISLGMQALPGKLEMFVFEVSPKQGRLKPAFMQAFGYLEKIKRYGFTPRELIEAKNNLLKRYTASLSEKNKTPSLNFVNDYKEMFLNGAAAPGMEWQVAFVKKILPEISLDEITAFSNKCLRGINTDILVLGPENEKTSLPDSTMISSWITEIESSKIPSFEDEILPRQLPLISRSRGKIISSKEIKALGVTYLQLSNGINVLLKPTDFKNDQIYFRGFRQGGTSLYDDSRVDNAAYAGALMSRFGLGDFNSTQLAGILNGKIVSVSSNILSRSEVVNGGSSHADLETALHIAHLQFTSSGKDTSMFKNIISNAKESVNGRKLDPQAQFTDTITAVTGNYAYRNQPVTAQRLDNIDVRDVLQIYKERFSDASGFTFTFVGSFNVDSIKPLIEIYLASLPSLKKRHRAKDLGIHIPSGQFSKTVFSGSENKASVRLVFSGNHQYTAQNNLRLKALGDILQDRVLHRLRELEGGVYSASVQVAYAKIPSSRYALNVSFGCAPDNVEHLIASVLEEMENIVQNGVSEDDILKFKAAYSKNVELALGDNSFWLNYLSGQIENKENLMEVNAQTSILSALNREAVATAASKYFSQENLIRFLLLPKYSAKPKTD